MTEPSEDLTDELRDLDQQIDGVTRDIDSLREQLADSGALDSEERAAILTNREELEGVLDGLRRRRDTLQKRHDAH